MIVTPISAHPRRRVGPVLVAALGMGITLWAAAASAGESDGHRLPARQTGIASWYGYEHNGRPTASGEMFDARLATAAHRTLPLGTMVKVTSLTSGASVVVRINDRGPFGGDRVIDLSMGAARQLGIIAAGHAPVGIDVISHGDQLCAIARPRSRKPGTNQHSPTSSPTPSSTC